eukprot:CAMPEP_0201491310 /NCGR_PEP_ID=MMETSP0151_2-20130828/29329_1 /ASSEMBLY_ACC=CAM_ASM_000257 /TAXON_ID=200890 /ORGANISM="Paramoeba atlantica, Strain 621/1 / CCAP 1560/9" /LENGTH=122 /DNA_ID=CAMNT_0047877605 /DNA_START=23 /DNA_END=387 /DNA_ORIENTATION=-
MVLCSSCGKDVPHENARFCSGCGSKMPGAPAGPPPINRKTKTQFGGPQIYPGQPIGSNYQQQQEQEQAQREQYTRTREPHYPKVNEEVQREPYLRTNMGVPGSGQPPPSSGYGGVGVGVGAP